VNAAPVAARVPVAARRTISRLPQRSGSREEPVQFPTEHRRVRFAEHRGPRELFYLRVTGRERARRSGFILFHCAPRCVSSSSTAARKIALLNVFNVNTFPSLYLSRKSARMCGFRVSKYFCTFGRFARQNGSPATVGTLMRFPSASVSFVKRRPLFEYMKNALYSGVRVLTRTPVLLSARLAAIRVLGAAKNFARSSAGSASIAAVSVASFLSSFCACAPVFFTFFRDIVFHALIRGACDRDNPFNGLCCCYVNRVYKFYVQFYGVSSR
jgi:hypothetical protein